MGGWLELTLGAAFVAGLTGGVHCAAMCGPLIGLVSLDRPAAGGRWRWLRHALSYNAGRIASYACAGAVTGALGAGGLALRGGPATQSVLLALASIAMLLLAGYIAGAQWLVHRIERVGAVLWRRIEPHAHHFLPADTPLRAFGLGMVWGWLPCGMVYVALIAALATADPLHGALVMVAFGLGTLPNLLAVSAWLGYARRRGRSRLARFAAALAIGAAGVAGLAHAADPHVLAAGGAWCLQLPGLAALFGGST